MKAQAAITDAESQRDTAISEFDTAKQLAAQSTMKVHQIEDSWRAAQEIWKQKITKVGIQSLAQILDRWRHTIFQTLVARWRVSQGHEYVVKYHNWVLEKRRADAVAEAAWKGITEEANQLAIRHFVKGSLTPALEQWIYHSTQSRCIQSDKITAVHWHRDQKRRITLIRWGKLSKDQRTSSLWTSEASHHYINWHRRHCIRLWSQIAKGDLIGESAAERCVKRWQHLKMWTMWMLWYIRCTTRRHAEHIVKRVIVTLMNNTKQVYNVVKCTQL